MYGEKSFKYGNLPDLKLYETDKRSKLTVLRGSFPGTSYGHRATRYALCCGMSGERPASDNYFILKADDLIGLHDLLGKMIDSGAIVDEVSEEEYKRCCDDASRRRWLRDHRHGFGVRYE